MTDDPPISSIVVPAEQLGRQAVASLGGYAYQIARSVSEWMRLGADQRLLLEVAEDFAVVGREALTMTQVKQQAAGSTVTLRAEGVVKAINSLWQHQNANPDVAVRMVYLTTARTGRERGVDLPDQASGIDYWRRAASGSDVEPLRTLLLEIGLDDDLVEFVRTADAPEVRRRLLSPIHFATDADTAEQHISALAVRLGERAAARGLLASDGEQALPALFLAALQCAVGQERLLTSNDFERCFEAATTIPVSATLARRMTTTGLGEVVTTWRDVCEGRLPPLPRRLARRELLVDDLATELSASVVWINGSSGLGKSRLAALLAERIPGSWRHVRLRGCSELEAEMRVRQSMGALDMPDFAGFVIDDLPVPSGEGLRSWISVLVRETVEVGGRIIVTSDRPPLPPTRQAFEPIRVIDRSAPYLAPDDVAEIVKTAGGDPGTWAGVVHLTCGRGHPLLTDARVAGLASRGWPAGEQLAGLVETAAEEVAGVRKEVALRLLSELSPNTHALLLRLSLSMGPFDRSMVHALAEGATPIPIAGALLDFLVGPWVEEVGSDRYSLSPLLAQSGQVALGDSEQRTLRTALIDNLVARQPFPSDLLTELLVHSLIARELRGLSFIAGAFLTSPDRETIARACPMLAFVEAPDGRIQLVPENEGVSSVLRLAQLITVTAEPRHLLYEKVLNAALTEIRSLDPYIASVSLYASLLAILGSERLSWPPKIWFPLLLEFDGVERGGTLPAEFLEGVGQTELNGLSPVEFFFVLRSGKVADVAELDELFRLLDGIEPGLRGSLLSASTRLLGGPPLFIQTAWATQALAGKFDAPFAAEAYAKLAAMAETWDAETAAIECYRSRAVITDEYMEDGETALVILDNAEKLHLGSERLARTRAGVLARLGRNEEARAALADLHVGYSVDEPLERALMLQAAAVSAGKTLRFAEAGRLFRESFEALVSSTVLGPAKRAALLCEAAVAEAADCREREALSTLRDALVELDLVETATDDGTWFVRQGAAQVAQWLLCRVEGTEYPIDLTKHFGDLSTLSPNVPESREGEAEPIYAWYLTATIEAHLGTSLGLAEEVRRREATAGVMPAPAARLGRLRIERAFHDLDVDEFLKSLQPFVDSFVALGEGSEGNSPRAISSPEPGLWAGPHAEVARGVASAFVGFAYLRGGIEGRAAAETLQAHSPAMSGLVIEDPIDLKLQGDMFASGVAATRWISENSLPSAEELLITSARIFLWLAQTMTDEPAATLHPLLVERWTNLARNRAALLTLPRLSVPAIEQAAASALSPLPAIAEIVQAGAIGSSVSLPREIREHLETAISRARTQSGRLS